MSRELYESPIRSWDVDLRVRRLEERVAKLEAALADLAQRPVAGPKDPPPR
jgi:hypothetical protein